MRHSTSDARAQAYAEQLLAVGICAVHLTLAAQTWYSPDSTIANKAIDCHYMNAERHLGRICVAHEVLFDRQQQEAGQMLNMLVRTSLGQACPTDPASAQLRHSIVMMLIAS